MSILIKGMEMPDSCYDCRFFVDAWCYAFGIDDWRNAYNKPPKGERLDNCPLVEVPTQHGRLLDADDVFHVLTDYYHHSTDFQREALKEALARVSNIIDGEESQEQWQE